MIDVSLALSLPVLLAAPWAMWRTASTTRTWSAKHVSLAAQRASMGRMSVAVGVMELAVASALTGFAVERSDYSGLVNVVTLTGLGVGLIWWGRVKQRLA